MREIEKRSQAFTQAEDYAELDYENKQLAWKKAMVEVEEISDRLGEKVDPGVRETVAALHLLGINTTGSCEGHNDRGTGGPYIDIESSEVAKLDRLLEKTDRDSSEWHRLLAEIKSKNLQERAKLEPLVDEFYLQRQTEPGARLEITHLAREWSRLESQAIRDKAVAHSELASYQNEMDKFTEFLKSKYFGLPAS